MHIWQPDHNQGFLVNTVTQVTLEFPMKYHLAPQALRMTIRDNCDYASIGEFDWRHVTSSDSYRHAGYDQFNGHSKSPYTLCDKLVHGVTGYSSDLAMCPHCLNEIKTLNSGFVPEYDSDWAWKNGFLSSAIELTQLNNQAYAKWIRE